MAQATIIDGDGHIFEDGDGIARHFPYSAAGARLRSGVFPLNSHIQYSLTRTPPGAFATNAEGRFENPGPEGWSNFMDQVGIDYAVLFPTAGQRIGRIVDRDYAVGAARAYNDWLAETYLRRDPRFKGVAIVPRIQSIHGRRLAEFIGPVPPMTITGVWSHQAL